MRKPPQNPQQSRDPTWGEGQHAGRIENPQAFEQAVERVVVRLLQVEDAPEGHVVSRRQGSPYMLRWEAPGGGGGGSLPAGTLGDLLYHDGADWVSLPAGSDGDVLKMVSGVPAWVTPEE